MSMRLDERVFVVTGGGYGIGRVIARELADEGARVMIVTRTASRGQETADEIASSGGVAALHAADLSSRAAVREAIAATRKQFGRLDAVIHNAGYVHNMPIGQIDDKKLGYLLDLNLKCAMWLAEEATPALAPGGPRSLLFVSSITGNLVYNQLGFSAYGASKAGLSAFIRSAAFELGPKGVRVNGVQPGLVTGTETAQNLSPDMIRQIEERHPLRRIPNPKSVARALIYLASEDAADVTGQLITVDCGFSLGR